tara:strand:+ start:507 stop:728 length:222 start_codon:yes stop_codon:yes gene_type:complete
MNNLTTTNNSPGFKGDKLDLIASIFEARTGYVFDDCISDKTFSRIVVDHADEPARLIAVRLGQYANGENSYDR